MTRDDLRRGMRVWVGHESGLEAGTVEGWTHTPDPVLVSCRWDDGTYSSVSLRWVLGEAR